MDVYIRKHFEKGECENTDSIGKSEWKPIVDCRDSMNLAVTPPDTSSKDWRTSKFDPENDNQLWRQDSEGRIINKANGKAFIWDQSGPRFVESDSRGFKWSFNTCIRSSQEPSGSISQKFQAKSYTEKNCLNTANRFTSAGAVLMLYPCKSIHPVNGCFKFKERSHEISKLKQARHKLRELAVETISQTEDVKNSIAKLDDDEHVEDAFLTSLLKELKSLSISSKTTMKKAFDEYVLTIEKLNVQDSNAFLNEEIELIFDWADYHQKVLENIDSYPVVYLKKYAEIRAIFNNGLDDLQKKALEFLERDNF